MFMTTQEHSPFTDCDIVKKMLHKLPRINRLLKELEVFRTECVQIMWDWTLSTHDQVDMYDVAYKCRPTSTAQNASRYDRSSLFLRDSSIAARTLSV